jgi:AraC-like DNA-binding protein
MTSTQTRHQFSDVDEISEVVATAGYNALYTQTHPGRIDIRMAVSQFSGLTVVNEKVSIGVEFFGSPPPGQLTFIFLKHGPGFFVNGLARGGARLYLAFPGSEVHCITGGEVDVFSISGPFQIFEEILEDREEWVRALAAGQVMPIPITDHQADDLGFLLGRNVKGLSPGYVENIAENLVDRLREILAYDVYPDAISSPTRVHRRQKFLKARGFILEHLDNPISSADLVHQAAMSERSLQRLFRQQTGLTPREYVRIQRLNAARRHIRRSAPFINSIHTIAFDNGYTHAGRFACDFREHFGVLPRALLKQQARAPRASLER